MEDFIICLFGAGQHLKIILKLNHTFELRKKNQIRLIWDLLMLGISLIEKLYFEASNIFLFFFGGLASELDQLYKICCVLGRPDWSVFPEARNISRLVDIGYFEVSSV